MSTTYPTTKQTFTNPVSGAPNDPAPVADGLDTTAALQDEVGTTTSSRSTSGSHALRLNELFARAKVASTAPSSPVTHDSWVDISATPYLLKVWSGSAWQTVGTAVTGMTNPMTTLDDLVLGGASGTPGRLAVGADGQVLTVDPTTHHPAWAASASGFANPMVAQDDLIIGGVSGTAARMAKGTDGQQLIVDPVTHHLIWATPSALSNPMTTLNDLILGGASGTPARLAPGAAGQVLTVDPGTLNVGWANSASGFANPMIAQDDLIVGGTSGTGTRLAKGSDSQVLTISPSTHHPVWAASGGMTNPMSAVGDLIYGGASGTPTRRAVGSTGDVLTVSGGNPTWAAPSGASGGALSLASYTAMPTVGGGTISWNNQGSATVAQGSGGTFLVEPGTDSDAWRMLEQTVPGGAFNVTAAFLPLLIADFNAPIVAITMRDNATGRMYSWGMRYNSGLLFSALNWSSSTVIFASTERVMTGYPPLWWRLAYDGASNTTFDVSWDGVHFTDIFGSSGNYVGTPTHAAVGVKLGGTNRPTGATIYSWTVV